MKTILARIGLILIFALTVSVLPLSSMNASAIPYGDGKYGTCTYDNCGISVTSDGSVSINITPAGSGTLCSDQTDNVGVNTDSSTGYTLTLASSTTSTSMSGASHGGSISADSGTPALPVVLGANQWGYRVAGLSGFGSGPSSVTTNTAPLSQGFAGVQPSNGTPDTIATSSSPADPTVTTTVWYGVCADTSIPADTYTSSVTYTAVVN